MRSGGFLLESHINKILDRLEQKELATKDLLALGAGSEMLIDPPPGDGGERVNDRGGSQMVGN